MIRATITSAVDQALLSALNFGLAVLLIHFASKPEYGLYSQLMNLQAFFSPFHAGIFASAYLALASKLEGEKHVMFRTAMARAEVIMSVASTLIVILICVIGARLFWATVTPSLCLAFGIALLGLWWREFARQMKFSTFSYDQVLNLDLAYILVTTIAVAGVLATSSLTTTSAFWCVAVGGIVAAAPPLAAAARGVALEKSAIRDALSVSWKVARWDVLGSIVTWTYAQSYVYFAALHGGLDAAAEISAGRLLATPLSLMWASYGNVLRPNASRLTSGLHSELRKLALRSALFVVGSSLLYALTIFALIPTLNRSLFGGKFEQLVPLTLWWIVYVMLTGISTVASSVLRSALEFRQVFQRQVVSGVAAVALLTMGLKSPAIESLVIALILVEAISAGLFWHRLNVAVSLHTKSA
jgi:O-antigen/teichoic acid export membrane protein